MSKQMGWEWPDEGAGRVTPGYSPGRSSQSTPSFYEELRAAGRYGDDLLRSLNGRNPDLLDAAEEVAAEQHVQIALISREAHLTTALLAALRQEAVTPAAQGIVQEGIWLLVALPATSSALRTSAPSSAFTSNVAEIDADFTSKCTDDSAHALLTQLRDIDADILLYLVAREAGWCAADTAWLAQLRTLGAPILPVVATLSIGAAQPDDVSAAAGNSNAAGLTAYVQRQAGVKPVWVHLDAVKGVASPSVDAPPATDCVALVQRIVALRPHVAVALAQDIAWCRPLLARRIIRTGAFLTALLSAQPVPLLDLPFQVVLQWKVALQLAAIYGRPGLDYRSREMVGTMVWNLLIRFVMQQAVRLAPVVGWLLSALIGGVSTALLGHALVTLYENEDRWDLAQQRRQALMRAAAAVTPVRKASLRAVDALRTQRTALFRCVRAAGARCAHCPSKAGSESSAHTSSPEPPYAAAIEEDASSLEPPPTLPVVNLTASTRRAAR